MSNYVEGFTAPVNLSARSTALVVVDMQNASGSRAHGLGQWLDRRGELASAAYRFDRIDSLLIPNIGRLLAAFRAAGIPVPETTEHTLARLSLCIASTHADRLPKGEVSACCRNGNGLPSDFVNRASVVLKAIGSHVHFVSRIPNGFARVAAFQLRQGF